MAQNELPRGKPRGIQERNPQELRSKLRGIYIPQERDKNTRLALGAMLAIALLFRLAWLLFTNFTAEDAFITFRFAQQIGLGNGFAYNPGDPIYGTTTPLFTLLLAVWSASFPPPA